MAQSKFWKGVTTVLAPGVMINKERNKSINDAQNAQNKSIETAENFQQANFDYVKGQNEPIIKIGDQYLDLLRQGVESGAFNMDESMFKNYQQYVVPEYEQGGKFESMPRESIITPERYQHNQSRQQLEGRPDFKLDQTGMPTLNEQSQFEYADRVNPQTGRPDIHKASNAPDAQYYDPTKEQYKSKEFSLADDPVYQKRLQQSGQAIEDSAARQGMQLSGANLKSLQENAQDLAAEEGGAAWNRFQQDDQQQYARFRDQRGEVKDATRFNSADEYQRYLDQTGIRKEEQGQLIAQWEKDRQYGSDAYNTDRNFAYNRSQDQNNYDLARFGAQQGQYQNNVQNQMAANQMNADNSFRNWNAQNQDYNADRQFGADQSQINNQNQFDVWNAQNQNTNFDNQMNLDTWNQQNQNNMDMYQYGTNLGYQANRDQYGNITDSYNRQAANKQNKYNTLGDIMNVGMTGRANVGNAMGAYSDSMSDLSLQRGNAAAAASAAKQANSGVLKRLGF